MKYDIDIKSNKDAVLSELQKSAEVALEAVGLKAEGYAKLELENHPRRIDTGLLRNSITHAVDGGETSIKSYSADRPSKYSEDSVWSILQAARQTSGTYGGTAPKEPEGRRAVYIGTNVDYAIYVHEGAASGFLKKLFGKADRMTPNRFLKNAMTKHVGEYKAILESYLSN